MLFLERLEYLRKRINFEVVTSRKVALKRIARPNFQRANIFREDLVGIHMAKPDLHRVFTYSTEKIGLSA